MAWVLLLGAAAVPSVSYRQHPLRAAVIDPQDENLLLDPNCGPTTPLSSSGLKPDVGGDSGTAVDGTGAFRATDALGRTRCFGLIAPAKLMASKRLPVIVWFHGVTDDANVPAGLKGEVQGVMSHGCGYRGDTGHTTLAALALKEEFAVVCPEASRFGVSPIGTKTTTPKSFDRESQMAVWEIPPAMNHSSGTPCSDADSRDLAFLDAILGSLDPDRFDLTRVYFAGATEHDV
jgi:hypothetical protein